MTAASLARHLLLGLCGLVWWLALFSLTGWLVASFASYDGTRHAVATRLTIFLVTALSLLLGRFAGRPRRDGDDLAWLLALVVLSSAPQWRSALLEYLEGAIPLRASLLAALVLAPVCLPLGWHLGLASRDRLPHGRSAFVVAVASLGLAWLLWPRLEPWVFGWGFSMGQLTLASGLIVATLPFLRFRSRYTWAVLALALGCLAFRLLAEDLHHDARGLVAVAHGPGEELRIVDRGGTRYLLRNGVLWHSTDVGDWQPRLPVDATLRLAMHLLPSPGRALLYGLQDPAFGQELCHEGWRLDTSGLPPHYESFLNLHFRDPANQEDCAEPMARFDSSSDATYDLLVAEIFHAGDVATWLSERPWPRRLSEDGAALLRLKVTDWQDPVLKQATDWLRQHFREVWCLPVEASPRKADDVILMASQRVFDTVRTRFENMRELSDRRQAQWIYQYKRRSWENRFVPKTRLEPGEVVGSFDEQQERTLSLHRRLTTELLGRPHLHH